MPAPAPSFDFAPYALSTRVYGALLNHAPQLEALGSAARQPPYKAPPRAPVLQIKPRNTLAGEGDEIELPEGVAALEVGASLAMVIGRTACRVAEADALDFVAGYLIAADLCVPHASHYRPAVRERCRDGFCPLGERVWPRAQVPRPDELGVRVFIDDRLVQASHTGARVRNASRLLADVSEFMTLQPGDVLLLGAPAAPPRVRAGQRTVIEIDGLGRLSNRFIAARARP